MFAKILSTLAFGFSAFGYNSIVDEPSRVVSTPYLGTYSVGIRYLQTSQIFMYVESPNGINETELTAWDTNFTLTTSDGYATASFFFEHSSDWVNEWVSVGLNINVGDSARARLAASYEQMQTDESYTIGTNWDISEFNYEYRPEISFVCEWQNSSYFTSSASLVLPKMFEIRTETFGTQESDSVAYLKENTQYSRTFNAIYTDDTEPKLYAFWLDNYMLARQVRVNGDIINQNYVTGLDRLDPTFGKQVSIRFTPTDDVDLKVLAVPYDPTWSLTNDYNTGYNAGYQDGVAEGTQPLSWVHNVFNGLVGFFSIEIFPHISIAFLAFSPLLVVAIIAIVRILKHD